MTNSIASLVRDDVRRLEAENAALRSQLAEATERLANVRTKLNKATECYAAGREMFEVMFLVNCCIDDIEKTIFPQHEQQGGG